MVRTETEKRGMTVSALGGEANMVAVDEKQRGHAIERLKHPDNETREAWQVLHNTLEQVLPVAEAAGVSVAFEPEVNNVANTAQKSRRLIDEMGSPNLKVVMDAANLFGEGELPRMTEILDEAFDLLGDHIAIAHGKDLDHDGDAGHLAAGTGKLDYEHYVSLLCKLPFDVPIILHGLGEHQVDDCVAMRRRLERSNQPSTTLAGDSLPPQG